MALFKDWQQTISVLAFVYLTLEFIIYKGFGRKAFLLTFAKWCWSVLNSYSNIMRALEAQNKEQLATSALIYTICQKVERIDHETAFNSGSSMKDAVIKMADNLAVYMSEREAELYIDPKPIFKTDKTGALVFVNAAWLELVGCNDEDEVIGFGYMVAIPENDKDMVEKQNVRFSKSPAPFHGEFTYQHMKSKEPIKTIMRTQLIKNRNNEYIGAIGTVKPL